MPRREQERREKAGKVRPGGACEGKRGMEEKNRLRCPAGSREEEKKREK
ncbi:Uncharacterised protein [uncultured Clostridium sp.]|nr:Uncharacterised protein [uncultured Clostridium sp.]